MDSMQYAYYHNDRGPHVFVFDLDANAQTGTFNVLFQTSHWFDKLGISDYSDFRRYAKGLTLWVAGGNDGGYFEGWESSQNTKLFTNSNECKYGWFGMSGPSSWSLGAAAACSLQAWTIAGDELGNTFARSAAGISHYDQTGQVQPIIADPFSGPDGKLVMGPQGELHLASRDKLALHVSKADASGTLQWSKNIFAQLMTGYANCFSHAVDAAGNTLLAFHSQLDVNLGNGPLPPLGPMDLILAKLDPQGNLIWSKRFGSADFTVKSCTMKRTGLDRFALLLDYSGTMDLGDGVLTSSPVLVDFDAQANVLWRVDLASLLPFVPERTTWTFSGHPSGAVFVSGTGYTSDPPGNTTTRKLRFLVAQFGP